MELKGLTLVNIISSICVLNFGRSSTKNLEDYGFFNVCVTEDKALRLECGYPKCDLTPFHSVFMTERGEVLGSSQSHLEMHPTFQNRTSLSISTNAHRLDLTGETVNVTRQYTCKLTRRTSTETQTVSVIPNKLKTCSGVAALVSPVGIKLMWSILSFPAVLNLRY